MTLVAFVHEDAAHDELFGALGRATTVRLVKWHRLTAGRLGYRLLAWSWLPRAARLGLRPIQRALSARTARRFANADALLFTMPDQAPLAASLGGRPRFYYAIDDFTSYGLLRDETIRWERALIAECDGVIAVSEALATALKARHGLSSKRLSVLPNAVPAALVPSAPPQRRAQQQQPIAGVLGRISSRQRLDWLRRAVEALPWLRWSFVGGVEQAELLPRDEQHLRWLRDHPRCQFVEFLPYRELARHAAELDVAVMPYSDRSTNPTGSPMRLFLHLAFGQPILATPGCAQVEDYVPLVAMCGDAEELIARLEGLRARGFDDGRSVERWRCAQANTWEHRAAELLRVITA